MSIDAYILHWSCPTSIQTMAGRLFGSKLWSEQTLVYFQSIHQEQTSLEFESKYNFVEENLFQYIFYNLAAILSRAPMCWNHKVFNLLYLFKCIECI